MDLYRGVLLDERPHRSARFDDKNESEENVEQHCPLGRGPDVVRSVLVRHVGDSGVGPADGDDGLKRRRHHRFHDEPSGFGAQLCGHVTRNYQQHCVSNVHLRTVVSGFRRYRQCKTDLY